MTDAPTPRQNCLLAALSVECRRRIYPHLELVSLALGKVLYESGDTLEYVHFPTDSIVSLLYVMENGSSAEISVVGNEGMVGISLFMGGESTPSRAVVQSAGSAYRLSGEHCKAEFGRHSSMLELPSETRPERNTSTPTMPSRPTLDTSAADPFSSVCIRVTMQSTVALVKNA